MLSERRLEVLRAIVQDYVGTEEPVGSKALTERHKLGVSPATVRNDMAALEDEGFIAQPHTSAGRIPTDKGYRLFVDKLAGVKPMTAPERRAIQNFLDGAVDLDDVVARTVRLLAQLTRQVAVVQYPSLTRSTVRHVELLALAPGPADAGADHGHRPGRAAHGRLPGAVRRGLAGGSAGPAQQPGRGPPVRGCAAAGAGPAGGLRGGGPRYGLDGALHPAGDARRGDRGAADDRRHRQSHPLRT